MRLYTLFHRQMWFFIGIRREYILREKSFPRCTSICPLSIEGTPMYEGNYSYSKLGYH